MRQGRRHADAPRIHPEARLYQVLKRIEISPGLLRTSARICLCRLSLSRNDIGAGDGAQESRLLIRWKTAYAFTTQYCLLTGPNSGSRSRNRNCPLKEASVELVSLTSITRPPADSIICRMPFSGIAFISILNSELLSVEDGSRSKRL